MKKLATVSLLASLSLSVFAGTNGMKVIYGEDNRKDVFESTDPMLVELSKSTAAMISSDKLRDDRKDGEVDITDQTLQRRGICAKERFSQQITAADCSGFLVAPNVLVTAGHCIRNQSDCASNKWVFDYKVDHADQGIVTVPSANVYSCKKIISRTLDQMTQDDYAVIELNRTVTDRQPLAFRRQGKITAGTEIAVIGHPTGLPTKITNKAFVRTLKSKYFVTNLDTYGGNSGSAVFNAKTGEVEGILVRGENDYVEDNKLGCQVSNVCTNDGCRGEDVTFITNIDALKKL